MVVGLKGCVYKKKHPQAVRRQCELFSLPFVQTNIVKKFLAFSSNLYLQINFYFLTESPV